MNMTIVGSAVLAVFIMIFLYMRGENYRRQVSRLSARLDGANRESKYLCEVVMELAKEEQHILQERLQQAQRKGSPNVNLMRLTSLLIEACETVINDSTIGHKTVHESFKAYVNNYSTLSYEDFNNLIVQENAQKRQLWAKNNLNAYFDLCKTCLQELA